MSDNYGNFKKVHQNKNAILTALNRRNQIVEIRRTLFLQDNSCSYILVLQITFHRVLVTYLPHFWVFTCFYIIAV